MNESSRKNICLEKENSEQNMMYQTSPLDSSPHDGNTPDSANNGQKNWEYIAFKEFDLSAFNEVTISRKKIGKNNIVEDPNISRIVTESNYRAAKSDWLRDTIMGFSYKIMEHFLETPTDQFDKDRIEKFKSVFTEILDQYKKSDALMNLRFTRPPPRSLSRDEKGRKLRVMPLMIISIAFLAIAFPLSSNILNQGEVPNNQIRVKNNQFEESYPTTISVPENFSSSSSLSSQATETSTSDSFINILEVINRLEQHSEDKTMIEITDSYKLIKDNLEMTPPDKNVKNANYEEVRGFSCLENNVLCSSTTN